MRSPGRIFRIAAAIAGKPSHCHSDLSRKKQNQDVSVLTSIVLLVKNFYMRRIATFLLLLLTQFVWLSKAGASLADTQSGTDSWDVVVSTAPQLPACTAVEAELELSEFLHQLDSILVRNDQHSAFKVLLSCQPLFGIRVDARGCRPPPCVDHAWASQAEGD
jgi:hypothetical protein